MDGDIICHTVLDVIPLTDPKTSVACFIVLFSEPDRTIKDNRAGRQVDALKPKKRGKKDTAAVHNAEMQRELELTKEYLKSKRSRGLTHCAAHDWAN